MGSSGNSDLQGTIPTSWCPTVNGVDLSGGTGQTSWIYKGFGGGGVEQLAESSYLNIQGTGTQTTYPGCLNCLDTFEYSSYQTCYGDYCGLTSTECQAAVTVAPTMAPTSTPTALPTSTPSQNITIVDNSNDDDELSDGTIAGIVVGVLFVVGFFVFGGYYIQYGMPSIPWEQKNRPSMSTQINN